MQFLKVRQDGASAGNIMSGCSKKRSTATLTKETDNVDNLPKKRFLLFQARFFRSSSGFGYIFQSNVTLLRRSPQNETTFWPLS